MKTSAPEGFRYRPPGRASQARRRKYTMNFSWLAAGLSSVAWCLSPAHALDEVPRDHLWTLIHDSCAIAAEHQVYPPSPCAEVAAIAGGSGSYTVFKDHTGRFQYLVLPLAHISGIESPVLEAADTPNYFAAAWNARLYVEAALHQPIPRDAMSLAINSAYGRTQDQLHIHIDCVRPDVHQVLQRLVPTLSEQWRPLAEPLPPAKHRYQARWVSGSTLPLDPFKSLAASLPRGDRMAAHSLAVVGAHSPTGEEGFILLSGRVDEAVGDRGHAEELQDIECAIALPHSP